MSQASQTQTAPVASGMAHDDPARDRWLKLALFAAWLALVVVMQARHTFFRDEVRALTLALQGNDLRAMLAAIHGDGHPAIWYLMLRAAHMLWASPMVLPVVAVLVAAAAALLAVLRGPFAWWMILLGLLTKFALFEYAVMARNYGVSVLLMFVIAAAWSRGRKGGVLLGVLLALLANTNVHSVILAGGFLALWLWDVVRQEGLRWSAALRTWAINTAIAAVGVIVCAATIYPPVNDAAAIQHPDALRFLLDIVKAVVLPGGPLDKLMGTDPMSVPPALAAPAAQALLQVVTSLALFGAALSLIRCPGAFLAALLSLVGLSLISAVLSHGEYRHDALWLGFVISLHWIVRSGAVAPETRWPARIGPLVDSTAKVAGALFLALLATQAQAGILTARAALAAPPPSDPASFFSFMARRPDLRNATIVADPDFLVEALPYYMPNPAWLVRENRFGNVVRFTRRARLTLALSDFLQAAQQVRARTHRPVVILLATPLDPRAGPMVVPEGYDWRLTVTPAETAAFLGAAQRLGHFSPPTYDGDFDAYLLK